MSDTQLDSDEQAFRNRYSEFRGPLQKYVQRLTRGDRQIAEDIVQETLLRAWAHAAELPAAALQPWIFTTARHLVIDAYRRRRSRPTEIVTDLSETSDATDDLDTALDDVLLADAFHALSLEHRTVLFDCYFRLSRHECGSSWGSFVR